MVGVDDDGELVAADDIPWLEAAMVVVGGEEVELELASASAFLRA